MFFIADVMGGDLTLTRFLAPDATNQAILTELIDGGNLLNGAKVGLTTNSVGVVPGSTYASLAQPTFTGYAASAAVTWGTPVLLPSGVTVVFADPVYFACTAAPSPTQTLYGWFLFAPGSPNVLLGGAQFLDSRGTPQPVVVNALMTVPVWPAVGLGRAA